MLRPEIADGGVDADIVSLCNIDRRRWKIAGHAYQRVAESRRIEQEGLSRNRFRSITSRDDASLARTGQWSTVCPERQHAEMRFTRQVISIEVLRSLHEDCSIASAITFIRYPS